MKLLVRSWCEAGAKLQFTNNDNDASLGDPDWRACWGVYYVVLGLIIAVSARPCDERSCVEQETSKRGTKAVWC